MIVKLAVGLAEMSKEKDDGSSTVTYAGLDERGTIDEANATANPTGAPAAFARYNVTVSDVAGAEAHDIPSVRVERRYAPGPHTGFPSTKANEAP